MAVLSDKFVVLGDQVPLGDTGSDVHPRGALLVAVCRAAGQPHRERVVVTETVTLEHRLAGLDDLVGELVDGALDAAAGDRADDLAAAVDRQRRPGVARRAAERVDDGGQPERLAGLPPLGDRVKDVAQSRTSRSHCCFHATTAPPPRATPGLAIG